MSGKVVGWAFEQGQARELAPTHRYVLIAYADNASEKDAKCWPDKAEIVEKTGLSQATVYRAIKALEEAGLLLFTSDEKGRECVYLAVPWSSQTEKTDSQSEKNLSHSEKRSNKGTVKNRKEGVSAERKLVNRKPVTDSEYDLASAVIAHFNATAGTRLTVDPHLTPIVGRIRERPELTAGHHRQIIDAVFAGEHWWSGPPSPRLIYGNASVFETSIEAARDHIRRAKQSRSVGESVNERRKRIRREQGLD
jgi:DNA-binding MarR family transcriptional regulator